MNVAATTPTATGGLPSQRQPTEADRGSGLLGVDAWGAECGIPLEDVVRVLPLAAIEPVPGAPPTMVGILRVGQHSMPVHDLGMLLNRQPTSRYSTRFTIVVVGSPERSTALVVGPDVDIIAADAIDHLTDLSYDITAPISHAAAIGTRQILVIDTPQILLATHGR